MKQHPLATFIPRPSLDQRESMRISLKNHGQIEKATVFEGMILDGWTRFQICKQESIEFKAEDFHENGITAAEFVVIKNLDRRHLTHAQKLVAALELKDHLSKEAKKRRGLGNHGLEGWTRSSDVAGKRFGLSSGLIDQLDYVRRRSKSIYEDVKSEKISLSMARKMVSARKERKPEPMAKVAITKDLVLPTCFESYETILDFNRQFSALGYKLQAYFEDGKWMMQYYGPGIQKKETWKDNECEPDFRRALVCAAREAMDS